MSDAALMVPATTLTGIDGRPLSRAANPAFDEEEETKQFLYDYLGPLDDIELFFNDVLVCKYLRREVAKGLLAAEATRLEDKWQGVVGLVLKVGHRAFVDDERTKFYGVSVKRGDWVLYRNTDGWDKDIIPVGDRIREPAQCRIIQDAHIRGRVKYPGRLL